MLRAPRYSAWVCLVRFSGLATFLSSPFGRRAGAVPSRQNPPVNRVGNDFPFLTDRVFAALVGLLCTLAMVGLSGCAGGFQGAKPLAALAPTVTQPVNHTVTAGQTATFTVTAGGTGPFTYQWFENG